MRVYKPFNSSAVRSPKMVMSAAAVNHFKNLFRLYHLRASSPPDTILPAINTHHKSLYVFTHLPPLRLTSEDHKLF